MASQTDCTSGLFSSDTVRLVDSDDRSSIGQAGYMNPYEVPETVLTTSQTQRYPDATH